MAIFSLARKGSHLIAAIKKGNTDQIKIELFFFSLITALSIVLILVLS